MGGGKRLRHNIHLNLDKIKEFLILFNGEWYDGECGFVFFSKVVFFIGGIYHEN